MSYKNKLDISYQLKNFVLITGDVNSILSQKP